MVFVILLVFGEAINYIISLLVTEKFILSEKGIFDGWF